MQFNISEALNFVLKECGIPKKRVTAWVDIFKAFCTTKYENICNAVTNAPWQTLKKHLSLQSLKRWPGHIVSAIKEIPSTLNSLYLDLQSSAPKLWKGIGGFVTRIHLDYKKSLYVGIIVTMGIGSIFFFYHSAGYLITLRNLYLQTDADFMEGIEDIFNEVLSDAFFTLVKTIFNATASLAWIAHENNVLSDAYTWGETLNKLKSLPQTIMKNFQKNLQQIKSTRTIIQYQLSHIRQWPHNVVRWIRSCSLPTPRTVITQSFTIGRTLLFNSGRSLLLGLSYAVFINSIISSIESAALLGLFLMIRLTVKISSAFWHPTVILNSLLRSGLSCLTGISAAYLCFSACRALYDYCAAEQNDNCYQTGSTIPGTPAAKDPDPEYIAESLPNGSLANLQDLSEKAWTEFQRHPLQFDATTHFSECSMAAEALVQDVVNDSGIDLESPKSFTLSNATALLRSEWNMHISSSSAASPASP